MKNIKYKVYTYLGVLALLFYSTSCLNDDRYVDFTKVSTVIEFPDAIPGKSTALDTDPTATDQIVTIRVNATGSEAPTQDLAIGIGSGGTAGLALYNTDNSHVVGTILPADAYTLPSTVTIVAGKNDTNTPNRTVSFDLVLHPDKIPQVLGVNYVLPVAITSVPNGSVASGNFGYILFNFYHNIYDGDYHGIGTRYNFNVAGDYAGWNPAGNPPYGAATGAIASTGPWNYPSTPIVTVNSTTSTVHVGNANGGFGTMNLIVNPDNTVTIVSTDATGVASLIPLNGGPQSTYDPLTKTFDLYYQYTNSTGTFRVLRERLVHN